MPTIQIEDVFRPALVLCDGMYFFKEDSFVDYEGGKIVFLMCIKHLEIRKQLLIHHDGELYESVKILNVCERIQIL